GQERPAEPGGVGGRGSGTAVLLASAAPGRGAALARRCAADAFPARVESGEGLARFMRGARPVADADAVSSPAPPEGAFSLG
ncbi:spermidine synthase-like protein, partial [Streptomyces sp. NPDC127110]